MRIVQEDIEFVEENRECSYFDEEVSDIRYRYIQKCSKEDYQNMLEHGWRRFGHMHFVPECKNCTKCISMRIDVKNYTFSKSDKRVLAKNKDTEVYIQPPSLSIEHLKLYDKYHEHMSEKKEWPYSPITPSEYQRSYIDGNVDFAQEFLYVRDGNLVGVALTDVLPQAISSIYCYYDHDFEKYSLGRFSILAQIKVAKELNIPYIYLGYWIQNHFSMGYKEAYQPFEILTNRASLDEITIWQPYKG
ncbi:arginyltransferase [Candidatus Marinarcus aquaticus]|uniref:Aspartate/glutamate leucyltransferase n=1 Tax=Candidatus Marinarcus aquaticus TaxID=2044504 RepID=A0A4Q0XNX0_9BACT|nr:arginyltransferase [Candidatus Marinarcus aquaticus]RXJ56290.1 arginyltransferase [Candidatus Marinarcus aquaticus]